MAQVGGVGQKLLRQIAVGGVQLYAVKACGDGVFGGLGVVGDDLADFGGGEFARGLKIFCVLRREVLHAFDFHRAGGGGQNAATVNRVRHAPRVPELGENQPAFCVHGGGYLFPRGNLRGGEQTGRERAAERVGGNIDGFRQNQTCADALGVILGGYRADDAV